MRLIVYPNGNGNGQFTHVSVFFNLMPGEYDDIVEFPLKANATVSLLNQSSNFYHHVNNINCFNFSNPNRKFVEDTEMYGYPQFIEHCLLQQGNNISYLQNDALYFRVCIYTQSNTKPWLTQ